MERASNSCKCYLHLSLSLVIHCCWWRMTGIVALAGNVCFEFIELQSHSSRGYRLDTREHNMVQKKQCERLWFVFFIFPFPLLIFESWQRRESDGSVSQCETWLTWLHPRVMLCLDASWCHPWTLWKNPEASRESGRTFQQPGLLSQKTFAYPAFCVLLVGLPQADAHTKESLLGPAELCALPLAFPQQHLWGQRAAQREQPAGQDPCGNCCMVSWDGSGRVQCSCPGREESMASFGLKGFLIWEAGRQDCCLSGNSDRRK